MENLSLELCPPAGQPPWLCRPPCTAPPTGPVSQNLPLRSLAGCLYRAPPPAPPANIELVIWLILPSLHLAWCCSERERVTGDNTRHNCIHKKIGLKLPIWKKIFWTVFIFSFPSDISVITTKSINGTMEAPFLMEGRAKLTQVKFAASRYPLDYPVLNSCCFEVKEG